MSIVQLRSLSEIVTIAEKEERFLTKADIQAGMNWYRRARIRIEACRQLYLSILRQDLKMQALNRTLSKYPELIYKDYGFKEKLTVDISKYFRMILQCLITGSTSPVDESLENSASVFRVFQLSSSWFISALEDLKHSHGLYGDEADEVNFYIDYIVDFLENLDVLTVSQVQKIYSQEWVTIEVTKRQEGFPLAGRVLLHNKKLENILEKIEELDGDLYTFYCTSPDDFIENFIE